MRLLFIILLIVLVIILLLFTVALKVKVVIDTCKTNLNMTLLWLHSFLKALVTIEDTKPMVTLYLLNKKLFKRSLNTGKDQGKGKFSSMDFVKMVDYRDVHVNANYGFRDPFTTGITCGAINAASQFINIDSINQIPDFATDDDYIYLDARAKVNVGSTLIKLLKFKH
jgi:hypothetical protein